MNEEISENRLRRLFPNASGSFIERNKNRDPNSGMPPQPESMVGQEMGKDQRNDTVHEKYSLKHVHIEFFANHGQILDHDNREYIAKIFNDSLVNLGFAKTDKNITSSVTQRTNWMDKDNSNLSKK